MPRIAVVKSSPIRRTPRVMQVEGLFDIPRAAESRLNWDVAFDLPAEWNIGAIVGPSGAGKTTIARAIWPDRIIAAWPWPKDESILDGFPRGMSIRQITGLLSAVGFSSPPAWLRPFAVLSEGQKFRVHMARTLAEMPELAVVDEFTSTVDRTAARIASTAVAKAVRQRGQRLTAVTCHYDVLDWLEPDWVFEPHLGRFRAGRHLWRRPPIELRIVRTTRHDWPRFAPHHYLTATLNPTAHCYLGRIGAEEVAFCAVLPVIGLRGVRRISRIVVLPDHQGIGIGRAMLRAVAEMYPAMRITTGHPGMICSLAGDPAWRPLGASRFGFPSQRAAVRKTPLRGKGVECSSIGRFVRSFEYVRHQPACRAGESVL